MDALGPLPISDGYKFVLVIVDASTKFCLLYPIYRQDVGELKRAFMQAVSLFGVPKLIVTDRGRMFEFGDFVSWVTELGSDLHYITPEMHHANGQAEHYIRTILNMLRIEVNHKASSWSEALWKLQLVTTQHHEAKDNPGLTPQPDDWDRRKYSGDSESHPRYSY